jgi:hypothetical protein
MAPISTATATTIDGHQVAPAIAGVVGTAGGDHHRSLTMRRTIAIEFADGARRRSPRARLSLRA